ncbi:hypothetical protein IPL68_02915 [Candidatus Saccharibacteria bacterium]|nr:MAG: hypothetical protein IPL68_02915 [Candidatus Saccharibacteria bacterium]
MKKRQLVTNGWTVYATPGTHDFLKGHDIATKRVYKVQGKQTPNLADLIRSHKLDLMVSIPSRQEKSDEAYLMRRLAIDNHIPLFTNAETGRLLLRCLTDPSLVDLQPKHWREYVPR